MVAVPDLWDPEQYALFADHRHRPAADLMARVGAADPHLVVDLGCGAGTLALELARRWPDARVVGVDSSAAMLDRARNADAAGRVEWVRADVQEWDPASLGAPIGVLVTNALVQWVPTHRQLLPRWVGALAPGGWFALQAPGNFEAPSHRLLRAEAARSPRAADLLPRLRGGDAVSEPVVYAALLAGLGCDVDAWETTYLHLLDPAGLQADPVLEWVRGTALPPLLAAFDDPVERAEFVRAYGDALARAYPRQEYGTPLPFRRVFAVAHRRRD
ncbi:methyltransferase domain-containing protein [Pengzhenrongella sicca]|uniref:methyltransferase domain-containing protein n=1 Tax=Pengzhenrongella sicca TaxID=2819238 RepID=UPI0029CA321B|nr:methyltransferase domain-containing protein [Pengzhenrongella sicca]